MRVVLRASGPAPADAAWERYADVDRWPAWCPQISAVHLDGAPACHPPAPGGRTARRLAVGARGTVDGLPVLGLPMLAVRFVVGDVDPASRRWSWSVVPTRAVLPVPGAVGALAGLLLVHTVTGDGRGSATTLEVTGAAPVVLAYALPAWVALRGLVR